jgi:hypothetical protein
VDHQVVVHYSRAAQRAGQLASQYVNENGFTTNHVECLWKVLREIPGYGVSMCDDWQARLWLLRQRRHAFRALVFKLTGFFIADNAPGMMLVEVAE